MVSLGKDILSVKEEEECQRILKEKEKTIKRYSGKMIEI
jgi:hypothetical protein